MEDAKQSILDKHFDKILIAALSMAVLFAVVFLSIYKPDSILIDWMQMAFSNLIGALCALMTGGSGIAALGKLLTGKQPSEPPKP